MGLTNVNCILPAHNFLVVDQIKNISSCINLPVPLSWKLASLPILSPIFLVILASIIFILLYLYKTSELLNKKRLIGILVVVILLFLAVNILMVQQNRPPAIKFRLAFTPIPGDLSSSQPSWIGIALWNMAARQLQNSVAGQAIVAPVEWTQSVIKTDSIYDVNYLKKLNAQLAIQYILTGKIIGNATSPDIRYQLIETSGGEMILDQTVPLLLQNLPEISTRIRDEILDYFKVKTHIGETRKSYISPEIYQQYLIAKDFFQQKKYQSAIDLAQQVIAADSAIVEAYLLAGDSYLMRGIEKKKQGESPIEQFESTKNWSSQAISLDSSGAEAYRILGEYYIYQERWSLAEQMLVKAFQLNPNQSQLYLSLSRLHPSRYQKLGFKNEVQLYKRAIFINPCYEDGYLMLSDFYLFENQRKKAIQVLEQYLTINPNSVPALMALGKIYIVRNEILKIIEIYNRVLELEPNNSDAYYNLGILYYNSKDYDNAEQFLKRAIEIDNHLNSHLYLAYLYEITGEYDLAIEQLRKRIRYRRGRDDEFAEEARKHLFKLLHAEK